MKSHFAEAAASIASLAIAGLAIVGLAIASIAFAGPAGAQALYDLPVARAAYEAGKGSGITASTTGEYLMCAAYWGTVTSATSGGYISPAQLADLGADFTGNGPQIKEDMFMALGSGANNAEERYTDYYNSAGEKFAGFIRGEEGPTRLLFETLGTCQRR